MAGPSLYEWGNCQGERIRVGSPYNEEIVLNVFKKEKSPPSTTSSCDLKAISLCASGLGLSSEGEKKKEKSKAKKKKMNEPFGDPG